MTQKLARSLVSHTIPYLLLVVCFVCETDLESINSFLSHSTTVQVYGYDVILIR